MHIEYAIAFVLYFTLLFGVAVYFRKKHASSADILVGGRKLNFWVTALSAQASDMSSWLFMAFPMSIFLGGMPNMWIAIGLFVGMFCTWQFIAIPLRVATEKYNSYTLATFLAARFNDTRGIIRTLTAGLCLFFLTYYLAAGLIAIGFLCESLFQFDYFVGVILATCVVVGYTLIGGFVSVAWADLFQALFLLTAIIIVPCIAFFSINGVDAIITHAAQANVSLDLFTTTKTFGIKDIIFIFFGWGLGYFGMPHIVTKFMGIKNAQDLRKGKYVGLSWLTLSLVSAACVGFVSIAYFSQGIDNPELVFVEMAKQLLNPFFAGFVLCGVIAATISTMDSQILVAASMLTEDVYKYWFAEKIHGKREIHAFRLSVIVMAIIAFVISMGKNRTIMDTVYYAWAGLGCSFSPLVLTALYSKKATTQGAIAGVITGGLIGILWPWVNKLLVEADILTAIPALIPGFFISMAVIWAVSALTHKKSTSH